MNYVEMLMSLYSASGVSHRYSVTPGADTGFRRGGGAACKASLLKIQISGVV